LGLIYGAGGRALHFPDPFRQIATAILLKRSNKWPHPPAMLATIAQVRQPPRERVSESGPGGMGLRVQEAGATDEPFDDGVDEWVGFSLIGQKDGLLVNRNDLTIVGRWHGLIVLQ